MPKKKIDTLFDGYQFTFIPESEEQLFLKKVQTANRFKFGTWYRMVDGDTLMVECRSDKNVFHLKVKMMKRGKVVVTKKVKTIDSEEIVKLIGSIAMQIEHPAILKKGQK